MSAAPTPLGRIVTFYSYKGGTGRSMAVANVAWILASNGYKVLAIDWDMEAPGLHRYFRPFLRDPTLSASPGIIDFFIEFADAARSTDDPDPDKTAWFRSRADLRIFACALDWKHFPESARLDFVPAGRQDPGYSTRVNSFNWNHFYTKLGGGVFLEETKRRLREQYDYVLIDSRTGVSDTSGICTVQMPDMLVACFTLNEQSISGAASAAASALAQRMLPSGSSALRVLPVATRVDLGEKERADSARQQARERFDKMLGWLDEDQVAEYWAQVETPYFPFYAFEEVLAVFGDPPASRTSMLASMEGLTSWVSEKEVQSLQPMDEPLRLATLARFLRPRRQVVATSPDTRYRFFVSYARSTYDEALERFVQDLIREVSLFTGLPAESVAWFDRLQLQPGDSLSDSMRRALASSQMLLQIDSPSYRRSEYGQRERQTFEKAGKPVLTVDWIMGLERSADAPGKRFTPRDEKGWEGFRNLLLLSQSDTRYLATLQELARAIVTIPTPDIVTPPVAPAEILVALLVARKGTQPAHATGLYGLRRRDWVPFPLRDPRTIGSMLAQLDSPQGTRLKVSSLGEVESWLLSSPRRGNQAALLVIDPESLQLKEFDTLKRSLLDAPFAPLAVVFCDEPSSRATTQSFVSSFLASLPEQSPGPPRSDIPRTALPVQAHWANAEQVHLGLGTLGVQLVNAAAELAAIRAKWHPEDDLDRRGELNPCTFTIAPNWRASAQKRWRQWGDVLVHIEKPPNDDYTYMLPSRRAPEHLRAPAALKEPAGLARKQRLTRQFVEESADRRLVGSWFYRRMFDESRRVHVYCEAYDDFLIEHDPGYEAG